MKARAQGLVEYGLIVVGVVIAAVAAVLIIGPAISRQFSHSVSPVDPAAERPLPGGRGRSACTDRAEEKCC